MSFLGIEFALWRIPLKRRMETLAALTLSSTFFVFPIASVLLFFYLLFSRFYYISLLYVIWEFYDVSILKTSSRGGRRWPLLRSCSATSYFRDYFPISLKRAVPIPADRNYLFGSHPHGIMGCASVCNFATDATGFSKLFPGITPHLLTLKMNFKIPFFREPLLAMGLCDVSKESLNFILTEKGTGNAAIVVVGGAEEALEARPGSFNVTLLKRKGFVRAAIRAGASLVPVFSFGENDLFYQLDNPAGSWVRTLQQRMKAILGVSSPYFYGRGVFNYSFGFLPHRRPILTAVGKPISVPQVEMPTTELIDDIHKKYMDGLSELFENYKCEYGIGKEIKLTFV